MAISRMQQPRQMYGLGSLVKKAVRGVKKIVKSPLGKAAIGGALMFGIPGTGIGGLFGRAGFGGAATGLFGQQGIGATLSAAKAGLAKRFAPKALGVDKFGQTIFQRKAPGFLSTLNPFGGNFSGKNAFLTAGALATAAPFLMDKFGGDEEVEEEVDVMDIAGIRKRARDFYRGATDTGLNFMPGKQYVQPNFYAAAGGRAMLNMGGAPGEQQAEQMLMAEYVKYKNKGGTLSFEQFVKAVMQAQQEQEMMAQGAGMEQPQPVAMAADGGLMDEDEDETAYNPYKAMSMYKRIGKKEGGIMDAEASEMIDMGGMEKDYRETGGFVEMGGKERADDVPARLSKNEFVFTADAVRNAGGGDIDKGAEVMENLMKNLEQGGKVSEDSQGLEGAQRMYDQQQMLQSRIA
jgi:hypothetical protein